MEIPASRSEPNSRRSSLSKSSRTSGTPPRAKARTRGRSTSERRPRARPSARKVNRSKRWQAMARMARTAIRACLRLATGASPARLTFVINGLVRVAPQEAASTYDERFDDTAASRAPSRRRAALSPRGHVQPYGHHLIRCCTAGSRNRRVRSATSVSVILDHQAEREGTWLTRRRRTLPSTVCYFRGDSGVKRYFLFQRKSVFHFAYGVPDLMLD